MTDTRPSFAGMLEHVFQPMKQTVSEHLVEIIPDVLIQIVWQYSAPTVLVAQVTGGDAEGLLQYYNMDDEEKPQWKMPQKWSVCALVQVSPTNILVRYRTGDAVGGLYNNSVWQPNTGVIQCLSSEPRTLQFSPTCTLDSQVFAVVGPHNIVTMRTDVLKSEWHLVDQLPRLYMVDEVNQATGACVVSGNRRVYVLVIARHVDRRWSRVYLMSFSIDAPEMGWNRGPVQLLPRSSIYLRMRTMISYGADMWFIGRSVTPLCYDVNTETWKEGPVFHSTRQKATAFVANDQLFVLGDAGQSAERFSVETQKWECNRALVSPGPASAVVSVQ